MHVDILSHHKSQIENLMIDYGLVSHTTLATSTLGAFAVTIVAIIHRFFLELTELAAFSTVSVPPYAKFGLVQFLSVVDL